MSITGRIIARLYTILHNCYIEVCIYATRTPLNYELLYTYDPGRSTQS